MGVQGAMPPILGPKFPNFSLRGRKSDISYYQPVQKVTRSPNPKSFWSRHGKFLVKFRLKFGCPPPNILAVPTPMSKHLVDFV